MKRLLHGLGLLCGACCAVPADLNRQIGEEVRCSWRGSAEAYGRRLPEHDLRAPVQDATPELRAR